jgi:archaellum component FlaF (FlaF/FlaG flagellin family)
MTIWRMPIACWILKTTNTHTQNVVPIIWLNITVVLAVISFSIIVSCIFISLLLVTVGIMYSRAGSSIHVTINILIDGENISFDASLFMYISIPPIIIMNRMHENQNLLYIIPLMRHTTVVCIISVSPMVMRCYICVNINLVIVLDFPLQQWLHERTLMLRYT